jgi:hypothetical protein
LAGAPLVNLTFIRPAIRWRSCSYAFCQFDDKKVVTRMNITVRLDRFALSAAMTFDPAQAPHRS